MILLLLNNDCVRDILSEVAKQPMNEFINDMPERLSHKYKSDDVNYALSILNEENCIHCDVYYGNDQLIMYSVGTMTKKGLDLYSKIQSDTVWNKVKAKIKLLGGSVSINLLSSIATNVVTSLSSSH
ncbi:DUF2513 domain-containing protein [Ligilactobacillus saerimneri]|uniref:DUF2513 domain-containing protein n=1 Tax=Ligilactobacillus saerimneri TaxID=228229 RepID=UPI002942600C|nr:DUF2513 domain-containing protein [Ligilactobacillus saerimneri]